MTELEFSGRRILVTGAGGGLGRALAGLFAARGGRVIGADRDPALLDGLPLEERLIFDLADRGATVAAARALADQPPDVLINNAGWTRAETLADLSPEKALAEIDLNLTSVAAFTTPVAAAMAARGTGNIVFISSVNAFLHYGNPAYAAAKAGLNAFTRALAVEYGGRGVRVNAVCPGSIRTPAWDHRIARDPTIAAKLERLYPMGRIVTAEEVAETVAFLASDRASGITGVSLAVDAGLSAGNKPFLDMILGGAE
ncbi:SDR family oxidoreductase [Frigidibacter sp. SD6-1]|uniref:SDR family oxidoreductase n=1 Tax=Frigidibacter sp. SD6-1 TaxID=3032581 RepID=UPI0024E03959|nr:SDR family oxidoreductase [Frigidibacter sp. SD6-1]